MGGAAVEIGQLPLRQHGRRVRAQQCIRPSLTAVFWRHQTFLVAQLPMHLGHLLPGEQLMGREADDVTILLLRIKSSNGYSKSSASSQGAAKHGVAPLARALQVAARLARAE